MVIGMFGLTPTELGITDDANRATSGAQAELARRKGIRPILTILEDFINEGVLSEFVVKRHVVGLSAGMGAIFWATLVELDIGFHDNFNRLGLVASLFSRYSTE